jgi:hypothetical protein
MKRRLLPTLLVAFCTTTGALSAQRLTPEPDLETLHDRLRAHAAAVLQRYGDTFYALGAYLTPDGKYQEFATDRWPSLDAPPTAWRDSLVASFGRARHPARAVAILLDLGRPPVPAPAKTAVLFHGETTKTCRALEESYGWRKDGRLRWARPVVRACQRLFPTNARG